MIKLLADASLPDLSDYFGSDFQITRLRPDRDCYEQMYGQDIILCRSTLKIKTSVLMHTSIQCIATLSSGIDHIIQDALHPLPIFDAKGSNAWAVADYIIASLAYIKKQSFILGARVGIIGMGAVGALVAQRLEPIGFQLTCYDPLRALADPKFTSASWDTLFDCDVICVHVNLHDGPPFASRNLLNHAFFSRLKPGAVIINAARGEIVDEAALLNHRHSLRYCTDVYVGEPKLNRDIIKFATLCTPHIAGHSVEARIRALVMASEKVHDFFGLPRPSFVSNLSKTTIRWDMGSSSSALLDYYDPSIETQALKQADNLTQAFLDLRQAHCHRHEFSLVSGLI